MEHLRVTPRTVVLLEGMHKIEGIVTQTTQTQGCIHQPGQRPMRELPQSCVRVLPKGGRGRDPHIIPDPKTGEQYKKMDRVTILFNEDGLEPLDPFAGHGRPGLELRDSGVEGDNTNSGQWEKGRIEHLDIKIPNINHPEYTARRKKQQEHLKSALERRTACRASASTGT